MPERSCELCHCRQVEGLVGQREGSVLAADTHRRRFQAEEAPLCDFRHHLRSESTGYGGLKDTQVFLER
jgi:hypothetical protein